MNEIKDALLRLVKAGRRIKKLQETYLEVGLKDGPLFESYGDICDAIYHIIGEHTDEYVDSVTNLVMTMPMFTDERRAEMLMAEYRKNHQEQPSPNLMSRKAMLELFDENGGYITPEGDWT